MKYDVRTNFFDLRKLCVKVGLKLGERPEDGKICNCSAHMPIYKNIDTGSYHFVRYRCKNRFCPICNHVKSTTLSTYMFSQYDLLKDDYNFIALTLTCINVPLYQLQVTQAQMFLAFRNLYKTWRRLIGKEYGFLRTYEVTYNSKSDTYHPHFHTIIAFPKSISLDTLKTFDFGGWFARQLPDHLTAFGAAPVDWGEHIPSHTQDERHPNISIDWECEPYDPSKSSLFEFTKYMSKFGELVNKLSDEDFRYYYEISSRVQVHTLGGSWRSYLKNMPEDIDEEVYVSADTIIQNANCVYIGSLSTGAPFLLQNRSFSFFDIYNKDHFTSIATVDPPELYNFISLNLIGLRDCYKIIL